MRNVRKFKFGPLFTFTVLSLIGFLFFTTSLGLIFIYSDEVKSLLIERFKIDIDKNTEIAKNASSNSTSKENYENETLKVFLFLSMLNAFGFLAAFVQLSTVKPTTRKILIPIAFVTIAAFCLLIAIDFYLEIKLAHMPPKEALTMDKPGKKGKSRFKTGYLIIYASMCIVAAIFYLAFKDLGEYLDQQKKEGETQEIIISHIT